jgi:hypothetical protein
MELEQTLIATRERGRWLRRDHFGHPKKQSISDTLHMDAAATSAIFPTHANLDHRLQPHRGNDEPNSTCLHYKMPI